MVTATVGEGAVKARLSSNAALPAVGDAVWLKVVDAHTCYYANEELIACTNRSIRRHGSWCCRC